MWRGDNRSFSPAPNLLIPLPYHNRFAQNGLMSSVEKLAIVDLLPGDLEAADKHVTEGTPFEPELARRIDARTERVSEEIYRERGLIDEETMQMLLDRDQK
ncbi:hypothetical protein BH10PLA2_BH10PLA2_03930 [soil metagenome]